MFKNMLKKNVFCSGAKFVFFPVAPMSELFTYKTFILLVLEPQHYRTLVISIVTCAVVNALLAMERKHPL